MGEGYKETKIGTIPETWEVKKLGSLGDFFKGKTITKDEITESGLPCIRYGDIYVQYEFANTVTHFSAYINKETAQNGRRLMKGDIIFAGTGETQEDIGKCVAYIRDEEAYAGGDLVVFRPKKDIGVDSEFLSCCLNTGEVRNRKSRLGQGLSIFHIYSSHLQTLEVPIPPLSEQKKIATILSTVHDVIEKTETIIEETMQLKKGLMQKLFTEGIGHTQFKETKIGRIPEEWEVVRFSELLDDGIISKIQDGNHGELHPKSSDFVDEGIPFIMANNVVNGGIDLKNCYFISRVQAESLRVGFSIKEDILLTHKGSVGNVAIVPEIEDFIMLTPQVTLYRIPEENRLLRLFLRYYFESLEFQKTLKRLSMQSTRAYIGISAQKKLWICLPRIKEQQKIAEILSEVDSKIKKELATKKLLEQLKKGLTQILLTGKVRVKV